MSAASEPLSLCNHQTQHRLRPGIVNNKMTKVISACSAPLKLTGLISASLLLVFRQRKFNLQSKDIYFSLHNWKQFKTRVGNDHRVNGLVSKARALINGIKLLLLESCYYARNTTKRPPKWSNGRRSNLVTQETGFTPGVGQISTSCHRLVYDATLHWVLRRKLRRWTSRIRYI